MCSTFELGKVYYATPVMGKKRRLLIPIGREGSMMQVAFLDGIGNGEVKCYDGREFVQIKDEKDIWNASARGEASARETAIVKDILTRI